MKIKNDLGVPVLAGEMENENLLARLYAINALEEIEKTFCQ